MLVAGQRRWAQRSFLNAGRMSAVLDGIRERYDLAMSIRLPSACDVRNDQAYGYYQAIGSD
jgi:hypothetical protein